MGDNTAATMRKERINRLLHELEYELTRGVMENEIQEEMFWQHIFPISRSIPGGVVAMEFKMRPLPGYLWPLSFEPTKARLRLVGENDT